MRHLGDITKISGYDAPVVDCVIGGSPCQDLSIAGNRAGLAGKRSGLLMEQIRIIKEMREADARTGRTGQFIRPRFMVWENVPGAFSSGEPKGEDFRIVLEETIRIAEPDAPDVPLPPKGKWPLADCWMGDGWSVAYRVLDAQFWGVPQRRRRIALVADFGGHAAPEILFVRKSVCGDTAAGGAAGEGTSAGTGSGAYSAIARSLTARYDGSHCIDRGPNVVCAGFKHKAGGEASGIGYEVETAPTLSAEQECAVYENHSQDSRVTGPLDVAPTVSQKFGTGGNNVPLVKTTYQDVAGTLSPGGHPGSYNGQDAYNDLLVAGVDCRNLYENPELSATLQAKENGGQSLNYINPVRTGGIVRRLTPLECERLQGYPDGWTDIGPWVDSNGKTHKESSDSARYKALGNSIALPPWTWVLKRLCACYERPATMASLFDGIGGFPLIWERMNGSGSCLWCSEIEEFPMAVTKVRFVHGSPTGCRCLSRRGWSDGEKENIQQRKCEQWLYVLSFEVQKVRCKNVR